MWMCAHVDATLQEFRRNIIIACQLKKQVYVLYQKHTFLFSLGTH